MQERNWLLTDLAEQSGIAGSVISRWMLGQQPSPRSIKAVATALSLPYEEVWQAALNERVTDEDPRRLELARLLERVPLTQDRYLLLRSQLLAMVEVADSTGT